MRIRFPFLLTVLLSGMALSGCQDFIYGKDNTRKPTELKDLTQNQSYPIKWSASTGVGTRQRFLLLTPAQEGNVVYAADSKGKVSAFNATTGKNIWRVNTKARISSGPVVKDNLIVVGTSDARVFALNAADGKILWTQSVNNEVLAAPAIAAQSVIVKTVVGQVSALNKKTGATLWTYEHENSPSLTLHVSGSPSISEQSAIVGFADGQLVKLPLISNLPIWQQQIAEPKGVNPVERMVDLDATPIVDGGKIYIASYQGNLSAFSTDQGELLWKHKISTYNNIASSATAIIVTDADGIVWAFSKASGDILWTQKSLAGRQLAAPAVFGENVLVGDFEGYLHRLSLLTGKVLGRTQVSSKDPIYTAPLIADRQIYVLTAKGDLVALDAQVKTL